MFLRLGLATHSLPPTPLPLDLSYAGMVEQLAAERQSAERLGLVPPPHGNAPPDPLARLHMGSNRAAAVAMAAAMHAHTHTHTHLHLHHQQEEASLATALAAAGGLHHPHPLLPLQHQLYPQFPSAGEGSIVSAFLCPCVVVVCVWRRLFVNCT